ncbi:MAG: NADH:ubiquinone reductase (Na(+)-transporting) subunit B [Pirellulaceae bacterium]|jgi:Na+-transporting NADH:ubiquinone oxidoreductase subunit B|nr:NADH:ubiquinone reductase (Na(+)-transporting) subunit B [Pirellulaceae bacterium]
MIRKLLDKIEPLFKPGGKYEKLYPLYEAQDTFLYTPGEVTHGGTHVRDALDLKRMMSMVIVALIPCIFMACYNTGYQAQKIMYAASAVKIPESGLLESLWDGSWRYSVMSFLGVDFKANRGEFLSFGSLLPCTIHGALFFLPIYVVTMAVGGTCELIFSLVRKHEINEGFLVTGMLFPLTLPPNIPLWQVGVGIAFGVVIGKEIFGGTGRNFLNPALTARAFLYFAYAKEISGDKVWTAVDGFSGATGLGQINAVEPGTATAPMMASLSGTYNGETIAAGAASWWDCFIGNMHGSMGETSALACLIGAAILIATRIGSWQIMAGTLVGLLGLSTAFWLLPFQAAAYNIPPWWHLVIGSYAFGAVFMATDPVSAAMTPKGKWIYGILIGVVTVIVRCMNIGFAEGVMLAILFANCSAPLIDYFVVQQNIKRRLLRTA